MSAQHLPLSDALLLAADLVADLDWNNSATWSGSDDLGLHADTDEQLTSLRDQLDKLGTSTSTTQRGEDYELTRLDYHLFSGLRVTVYGPSRELVAEA